MVSTVICTEIESRCDAFLDTLAKDNEINRVRVILPGLFREHVVDDPERCTWWKCRAL
jgi:hypothetical protein